MTPRGVRFVACALVVGTVAALLATADMGFTRDESFYFRYARDYSRWLHRLGAAEAPGDRAEVLGRDAVVSTWQGNFEHPPLMKTLFGASWRYLGVKDRRLRAGVERPLELTRLDLHDGFEVGAEVALLAPRRVGEDPGGPALGRARVTERGASTATLELLEGDQVELAQACDVDPGVGEPRVITGCLAREERPLALLSESASLRLPGMVATGIAVALTFLLGVATVGWLAGLLGALAFLLVPRHFFHGHLCAFDMAIVAATLGVLYAFWRSRDDRRWALGAGLAWGVAILIKHNALFLPVPLLAWWLWDGRHALRLRWRPWRFGLPPLPLALLVMPAVALPMLFVLWPRLWFDPFRSLGAYLQFHLEHDHYMQWYFGQPLEVPPFPIEFPFVLTALTVPEAYQIAFVVGLVVLARAAWRRDASPAAPGRGALSFLLLNGMLPIALIALPTTPIFGGIKHWMTGMPLLLLIAGAGLAEALAVATRSVRRPVVRVLLHVAVLALVFVPAARASRDAAAWGTGYWNSLVAGGGQGAADRHLMRLYWGHTSRQALDWLNEHAPRRARVMLQNTTHDAYDMYKREGWLRHDILAARGIDSADLALVEPQQAFADLDLRVRDALGAAGPDHVVRSPDGVPMLRVYARQVERSGTAGGVGADRRAGDLEHIDLEHHLPPPGLGGLDLDREVDGPGPGR